MSDRARFGLLVVLGGMAGCGAGQPVICDPLAAMVLPLRAGKVIGAGRDGAGVVYVVDDAAGVDRLFVSAGSILQRRLTNGEGSIGGTYLIVNSRAEDDLALQVAVETDARGPVRMGLHRGALTTKTFAIGSEGEELTLLGPSDLAGFSFQNLPGTVHVEHFATLSDGRLLVVTSPDVDPSYEAFRLFMGPADDLRERDGVKVTRGSYTQISFNLDGRTALAVFGSTLAPAIVSALTVDGQSEPLTVAPPGSKPEGATFHCTSSP